MEIIEGTQESAVGMNGTPVPSSMTSIFGAKIQKVLRKNIHLKDVMTRQVA